MMAGRLPTGVGRHAAGTTPVRGVLLDFYCTLVDLSDPVRSRGFDDFARRLGLSPDSGELYRRFTEMITSEPAQDAVPGFVPYRTSWLSAARAVRPPVSGLTVSRCTRGPARDGGGPPKVPDVVQALARHVRLA
jgi:hypothetical protein